jgi:hypothetical protein
MLLLFFNTSKIHSNKIQTNKMQNKLNKQNMTNNMTTQMYITRIYRLLYQNSMFDLGEASDILGLGDTNINMDYDGQLDEELLGFLLNTEMSEMEDVSASVTNDEAIREMAIAFEEDQKQPLPAVGKQRFKTLTEEQLEEIEAKRQSSSTKMKTKWGMKILQGRSKPIIDHVCKNLSNNLKNK